MNVEKELHETSVVKLRRGHDTTAFEARCSCGWRSRYCDTETQAENEATDHIVAIVR